ncbi:cytochrome P450 2A4-like [Dermacentor variabilis]|uniref:cytochrome P450 2A4-like n=1 Tax=Dermacentor variabilis TaxID=34621 RepID=UPI003F5BAD80
MDLTSAPIKLFQGLSTESMLFALCVALCILLTTLVASCTSKPRIPLGKRLPPGPRGLPIVGHLPYANEVFDHNKCLEHSKMHGPVIRFKMGMKDVVILNDFESIKGVLSRKELLNRTENLVLKSNKVTGITGLNGNAWLENRRFCLHVLRDFGFGKKSMEEHIREEAEYLFDKIRSFRGIPVDIKEYLVPSMSNNITALVFGRRYQFEDRRRKFLDERLALLLNAIGPRSLLTFIPCWATGLATCLPFTTFSLVQKVLGEFTKFICDHVQDHERTLEESSDRDFIDAYIKKIRENKDKPNSSFQMSTLIGNVGNFFGAGSNTVMMTVHWHILNCADKVDSVQRRIQEEIDRVVGRERQPRWEDHNKMPFTTAVIWEMYRWRTIAPLSIPREAAADVSYMDYFIPKGTIVMPNLYAVHMDPRHWKNPEEFNPGRFLTQDGSALLHKPEELIPFSIGRRMCPGETLANVEVFLYLTMMLQKFTVLPLDGAKVDLEPAAIAFNLAAAQKLRFISRE